MKTIYLIIAAIILTGCKSVISQQQDNCFSEENFQKVYGYVSNQINKDNNTFITIEGYEIHLNQDKNDISIKEEGYTLAKIHQKGIYSLNKSKLHNEKMVKTAYNLFCKLLLRAYEQKEQAYSNDAVVFKASVNPPGGLGAIGYGYLYLCKVQKNLQGNLHDTDFTIIILADDKRFLKLLDSENYPMAVVIQAIKHKTGEQSEYIPITGFVDKDMTSWKIVSIERISEEE